MSNHITLQLFLILFCSLHFRQLCPSLLLLWVHVLVANSSLGSKIHVRDTVLYVCWCESLEMVDGNGFFHWKPKEQMIFTFYCCNKREVYFYCTFTPTRKFIVYTKHKKRLPSIIKTKQSLYCIYAFFLTFTGFNIATFFFFAPLLV